MSLIESDGEIVIAVQDDGIGIPPDVLPHIFEPFYSGITHGSGGGLGIGLALTKGLVETHGGKISVISSGQGSKFTIVLPNVVRSIKADAKTQQLAVDGQAANACS